MGQIRSLYRVCRLLCLIFAGTLLSACFDNDDVELNAAQTLLTLDPRTIPFITADHWIYATDSAGYILDVKKTVGYERVTLSSRSRVNKFNLTIVSGQSSTNRNTYLQIQTFVDVEAGSTFDIPYGTGGLVLKDPSTVTFQINGYEGPEYGIFLTNRGYHSAYVPKIEGNSWNANIEMYQLPSDVFLTTYRSGLPVYSKISNVKDGDSWNLDMSKDFVPFEHQRKLDFKGYFNTGWVKAAYFGDNGFPQLFYVLIDNYILRGTEDDTNQPTIGYVGGFDIYNMHVENHQPSGAVWYDKQGNIEETFASFNLPTFTYKTTTTDLRNFTFEFSEDFTYYVVDFYSESPNAGMYWTIHAPKGKGTNIGNIPYEILEEYPMLRTMNFKYRGCRLTKVISGDSYTDNLPGLNLFTSPEYEYYTYLTN